MSGPLYKKSFEGEPLKDDFCGILEYAAAKR